MGQSEGSRAPTLKEEEEEPRDRQSMSDIDSNVDAPEQMILEPQQASVSNSDIEEDTELAAAAGNLPGDGDFSPAIQEEEEHDEEDDEMIKDEEADNSDGSGSEKGDEPATLVEEPREEASIVGRLRRRRRPVQSKVNADGEELHCLCEQPDAGTFMVACDLCNSWYHGDCIGITEEEAAEIEKFECSLCMEYNGALKQERITYSSERKSPNRPVSSNKKKSRAKTRSKRVSDEDDGDDIVAAVGHEQGSGADVDPVRRMARKGFTDTFASIFKDDVSLAAATAAAPSASVGGSTTVVGDTMISNLIDLSDPEAFGELVEKELFEAYSVPNSIGNIECGPKYKSKYRSLQFNLKDKNNTKLRKRVLCGQVSPADLVIMSPDELANEETSMIAQQVRRESFQNTIRPKDRGVDSGSGRRVIKTHKGEVEIFLPPETVIAPDDSSVSPSSLVSPRVGSTGAASKILARNQAAADARAKEREHTKVISASNGTPVVISPSGKSASGDKMDISSTPTRVEKKIESLDDILARMSAPSGTIAAAVDSSLANAAAAASSVVKTSSNKRPLESSSTSEADKGQSVAPSAENLASINGKRPRTGDSPYDDISGDASAQESKSDSSRVKKNDSSSVWRGKLHMPQVGKFGGTSRQAAGTRIPGGKQAWAKILPAALNIDGRIPIDRVTQYLAQQRNSSSKELVVVEFIPGSEKSDVEGYKALFKYFSSRQRYAVIGQLYASVKDMYVIPVKKGRSLPAFFEWIPGGEKYKHDGDVLLGVCVLEKTVVYGLSSSGGGGGVSSTGAGVKHVPSTARRPPSAVAGASSSIKSTSHRHKPAAIAAAGPANLGPQIGKFAGMPQPISASSSQDAATRLLSSILGPQSGIPATQPSAFPLDAVKTSQLASLLSQFGGNK